MNEIGVVDTENKWTIDMYSRVIDAFIAQL